MTTSYRWTGNVFESPAAGTTTFPLTSTGGNPIGYLQRTQIHVYLSGDKGNTWLEIARPSDWDFNAEGASVVLANGVNAGESVRILRLMPFTNRFVDFADGSLLTAEQLDRAEDYSRYCDQQLFDWLGSLTGGGSGPDDLVDLNDLGDVTITNPKLDKQVLQFDSATKEWINGSVQVGNIDPDEIITQGEVDRGLSYDKWDDTQIATAGAIKKLAPVYDKNGSSPPLGRNYPGKLWYEELTGDDTKTLRMWSGAEGWKVISQTTGSVAPFEPAEIIFVNTKGDDANSGKSRQKAVRTIGRALEIANRDTLKPAVPVDSASYSEGSGIVTINTTREHQLIGGNLVAIDPMKWTCPGDVTEVAYPKKTSVYPVTAVFSSTQFTINVGPTEKQHNYVSAQTPVPNIDPVDTVAGDGKIISVAAGTYAEELPLQVKAKNLSIIGDSLRNTYVHPAVPNNDSYDPNNPADTSNELKVMFELNSGSYLSGMTFAGLKAKGPRGTNVIDDNSTYGLPERQGWVAGFLKDSIITKSPYIQNCTNFADSSIDNREIGIYSNGTGFNPDYLGGEGGDTSSAPTGGGMLVDGNQVADTSPLRSFVVDAFTQVTLDGPGILVVNDAYAQLVSFFGTFCHYHAKALNGSILNLSNCTTDFGRYGLIADGKSLSPIFQGKILADAKAGSPGDQQEIVEIKSAVYDDTEKSLEIEPSTPLATPVGVGVLVKIQFLKYTKAGVPDKTIPDSFSLEYAVISGNSSKFKITVGSQELDGYSYVANSGDLLVPTGGVNGPEPSTFVSVGEFGSRSASWQSPRAMVPGTTMLMEVGGVTYPIVTATPQKGDKSEFSIQIYSPLNPFNRLNVGLLNAVKENDNVKFYQQSYISTGGHTMEYVGSGTNYTAHPGYGGVPVETNQSIELGGDATYPQLTQYNGGRVWRSSTDQDGSFRVGNTFSVNQKTGQIYIDPTVIVQPPLKIQDNIDVGPYSIYTSFGTNTNINIAPKGEGGLIIGGAISKGSSPVGPSTAPILGPVRERSTANDRDYDIATQEDIGYDPNQIPLSQHLGALAFKDQASTVRLQKFSPPNEFVSFDVAGSDLKITLNDNGALRTYTLTAD